MKALRSVTWSAMLALGVPLTAAAQSRAAAPGQEPPYQQPMAGAAQEDAGTVQTPILRISSVEIIRGAHAPVLDIIRVRGFASSAGWEDAQLLPLTRGIPADGVLHLAFVGRPPPLVAEARGFEAIEAIFPLEPEHPFKGVNVHSASESITVNAFPGYAEGKPAGEDCAKCVGKTFVARGGVAPSGKPTSELVREEQLSMLTRVVKASDGLPANDANPNRLTLILNNEGKITAAVWE